MRRIIQIFTITTLCISLILSIYAFYMTKKIITELESMSKNITDVDSIMTSEIDTSETIKDGEKISDEDVSLIALVTMAEAEGESEKGKRLVIDTILNRKDSEHFPNSIHDVIYQPNQFTSMWNGRINRCKVREDICQLVREEFESRTNYDVMFFTSGCYSKYGVPIFKVGNHYFSSYD